MRVGLMLAVTLLGGQLAGCKTAEIAVNHQMTGIHVVAKFEGKEPMESDGDAGASDGEEVGTRQARDEGLRVEYVTRRL